MTNQYTCTCWACEGLSISDDGHVRWSCIMYVSYCPYDSIYRYASIARTAHVHVSLAVAVAELYTIPGTQGFPGGAYQYQPIPNYGHQHG